LSLGHFTHELPEFALGKVAANAAKPPRDLVADLILSKGLMVSELGAGFRVFVGVHLKSRGWKDIVRQGTMQAVFAQQQQTSWEGFSLIRNKRILGIASDRWIGYSPIDSNQIASGITRVCDLLASTPNQRL